jgi:hypothetical protein
MELVFDKDVLKFSIKNLGRKNNNYEEDVIEDVVLYRASEIYKDIFKSAEIYSYRDKPFRKKLVYDRENDIFIIKNVQMPIYLLSNIYFEM